MGLFRKAWKKVTNTGNKIVKKAKSMGEGFKRDVVDSGLASTVLDVGSKVVGVAGVAVTASGIGGPAGAALAGMAAGMGVAARVLEPTEECDLEQVTEPSLNLEGLTSPQLDYDYDLSGVPSSGSLGSGWAGIRNSIELRKAELGLAGGSSSAGAGAGGGGSVAPLVVGAGLLWWLL